MLENNENNKLIYSQKREALKESISENSIFRTMINSLVNEGIYIDLEQFIDEYITFLGTENVQNNSAFDLVEINKFIIGKINYISQENNGVILNDDGTINLNRIQTDSAISSFLDNTLDYAENSIYENGLSNEKTNIFFLQDCSQEEKVFYNNLILGDTDNYDILNNLKYQENKNKDKVLSKAEVNRLKTFIETKDELNFILLCTRYENSTNPEEKELYLDKILELPYSQNYIDSETGEFDLSGALNVEREWGENHLKGRRKMDMIEYINLRKSGISFTDFSKEDKNRFLRSAIRVFENPEASLESKKIANAMIIDISPELLCMERDKDGNIISTINETSLVSLYNEIHADEKNVENADEIMSNIEQEEKDIILNKLNDIGKAETLMSYEQWKKLDMSRENTILGISKEIEGTSENDER